MQYSTYLGHLRVEWQLPVRHPYCTKPRPKQEHEKLRITQIISPEQYYLLSIIL